MTDRHHQLYQLVTARLRSEQRQAAAKHLLGGLIYEEASYWLSKARETRGQRAFRALFGIETKQAPDGAG